MVRVDGRSFENVFGCNKSDSNVHIKKWIFRQLQSGNVISLNTGCTIPVFPYVEFRERRGPIKDLFRFCGKGVFWLPFYYMTAYYLGHCLLLWAIGKSFKLHVFNF